jgi:LPXTG-site transpeptidase (sortase) family protein
MKKNPFISLWIVIFLGSYLALSFLDMIPLELEEAHFRFVEGAKSALKTFQVSGHYSLTASSSEAEASTAKVNETILPNRIMIEKIGVDVSVLNPETRDIDALDRALLEGAVRYPGSGGLDDESNMFIFAHSTGYKTVRNQAFKSFNHLGTLQNGDVITVQSGDTDYRYTVVSVLEVDANEALVALSIGKKMLTLSTCDSFGDKSSRFVVKAEFLQSIPHSTF